jgi:hypothetical protein
VAAAARSSRILATSRFASKPTDSADARAAIKLSAAIASQASAEIEPTPKAETETEG